MLSSEPPGGRLPLTQVMGGKGPVQRSSLGWAFSVLRQMGHFARSPKPCGHKEVGEALAGCLPGPHLVPSHSPYCMKMRHLKDLPATWEPEVQKACWGPWFWAVSGSVLGTPGAGRPEVPSQPLVLRGPGRTGSPGVPWRLPPLFSPQGAPGPARAGGSGGGAQVQSSHGRGG